MIMNEYYPGEPFNIHLQSLLNILQEKNRVITTKRGKSKLPLSSVNGEGLIPIYGVRNTYIQKGLSQFFVTGKMTRVIYTSII